MDNSKYIHMKDEGFKKLFGIMCCIDCGIIPDYTIKQTYGGTSNTINYTGWLIKDNKEKVCPLCYRNRKIKKLING